MGVEFLVKHMLDARLGEGVLIRAAVDNIAEI